MRPGPERLRSPEFQHVSGRASCDFTRALATQRRSVVTDGSTQIRSSKEGLSMAYEARNYDQLLGIEGLSDQLMKNHFTLYQGYVANTNKLADALNQMLKDGKAATLEYAELKRRFGWEFNGMRLHEYYFGNMVKGGKGLDPASGFAQKLAADWGSYDNWQKDFKASGAIRGIGWVALCLDPIANRTCT